MDKRHRKKFEKTLLAILGKTPDRFGLIPKEGGWVSLKDLHKALMVEPGFAHITPRALEQFFALYKPAKFECRDQHVRVLPEWQAPGLTAFIPAEPPEILYAAVRQKAHGSVAEKGLSSAGNRRGIVLAADRDLALTMGRRKDGDPILIEVRAARAFEQGRIFRKAGKLLYLTDELPVRWLNVPPLPRRRKGRGDMKEAKRSVRKVGGGNTAGNTTTKGAPSVERMGTFIPRPLSFHVNETDELSDSDKKRRKKRRKQDPEWKKAQRKIKKR